MKIVIAPDSFKESLTALQVAEAIEMGIRDIFPKAEYCCVPMADGGEGTVQSLVDATGGKIIQCEVTAPLGDRTMAFWGLSGDGETAIIEMASASGLPLVPLEQRNPLMTTSFGTGELIKNALDYGVRKIILGLGGSATNDGGVGMLQALGIKFLDNRGVALPLGGAALLNLATIDFTDLDPRLDKIEIEVACDVDNPLCGENGASAIFGPQKGATPSMVKTLDKALAHFADVIQQTLGRDIKQVAGSGAAGGMGGGLLLLPHVMMHRGIDIVLSFTELEHKIKDADWVITGEGRMDGQSIFGKTPMGVAKIAKYYDKPVIAIVGSLGHGYQAIHEYGIDAVFPIIANTNGLADALQHARDNVFRTAKNIATVIKVANFNLQ
ncbi:glycerate kinase [Actinobacillus delphinicola]|uniref:Glycerate kinase n=1 Tax=Actinobacillus delphinicola TaxID=51161 RepID=A0A448TVJ1_9PAST|nr:glycerate kinase [Actinobacillus delphinicola]VEJ09943.1 glycerate kinase [Actinobacillus delphinicola]